MLGVGCEANPSLQFGDVFRGPCLVPSMTHPDTATGRDAFRGLFVRRWVTFPYVYFYLYQRVQQVLFPSSLEHDRYHPGNPSSAQKDA